MSIAEILGFRPAGETRAASALYGSVVAQARDRRFFSALGVPDTYPSGWERARRLPSWRTLDALAELLDLEPGEAFLARVAASESRRGMPPPVQRAEGVSPTATR